MHKHKHQCYITLDIDILSKNTIFNTGAKFSPLQVITSSLAQKNYSLVTVAEGTDT
jgi:hypothetical protein